jgi:hypothetical protein
VKFVRKALFVMTFAMLWLANCGDSYADSCWIDCMKARGFAGQASGGACRRLCASHSNNAASSQTKEVARSDRSNLHDKPKPEETAVADKSASNKSQENTAKKTDDEQGTSNAIAQAFDKAEAVIGRRH